MHNEGKQVHVSEEEVSGGSKEGVVRWVLLISLLAAILILSIIWITGAATQDPVESEVNVSDRIQATEGDSGIDSTVLEDADDIESTPEGGAADTPLQTVEN